MYFLKRTLSTKSIPIPKPERGFNPSATQQSAIPSLYPYQPKSCVRSMPPADNLNPTSATASTDPYAGFQDCVYERLPPQEEKREKHRKKMGRHHHAPLIVVKSRSNSPQDEVTEEGEEHRVPSSARDLVLRSVRGREEEDRSSSRRPEAATRSCEGGSRHESSSTSSLKKSPASRGSDRQNWSQHKTPRKSGLYSVPATANRSSRRDEEERAATK
ncbi:hypothetical protein B0J14DRAFT_590887 [Halenospora varia]|nr:hypothetical protein B0J14DRAFT_590887 [Halenospora varia]